MAVFVLGNDNLPLMPCSEKKARLLLERKRAFVVRMYPFTIKLKDRNQSNCILQDIEVKIDPGSRFTGICVSRTELATKTVNVLNLFELKHRGSWIVKKLKQRAALRRNRRSRNTRYRPARFLNRTKPKGWLPPSLMHRLETTLSWVKRLIRWSPVTLLAFERVKFDMQKMQDPSIQGKEYQQGSLFEKEVMEYLLEKYQHTCVYCGEKDCVFEKEHVIPKVSGGSNRISNLVLSCIRCNRLKGSKSIQEFLKYKPELLKKILAQLKKPLKDAAAVNATRNRLLTELLKTGLSVETSTGAQTKYNRKLLHVPKTHALDAACVGEVNQVKDWNKPHLGIKCTGRGSYARTCLNKYGFPRLYFSRNKKAFGFQTGDIVKAFIKVKNEIKSVIGKITVRQNSYFDLKIDKEVKSISWAKCKLVQKSDGYQYDKKEYSFYNIGNQILTASNS